MDLKAIRTQTLSMLEVTEEPHFDYTSFRVRGKIFMTIPPDETHAHIFLSEQDRERALAMYPEFVEKLMWGKKVAGVRVALTKATPIVVDDLIRLAWRNKAPKRLLSADIYLPSKN
ncbi:MAG: MmcQ/YjbR family DNA-binding protein [Halioglobus sp.]